MRRRIAKRRRKNLIRAGKEIIEEGWITEPGWNRKSIGYGIRFMHNGWIYNCSSDDELDAYQIALKCIQKDMDIDPTKTNNYKERKL